jgi:hypothetical protein
MIHAPIMGFLLILVLGWVLNIVKWILFWPVSFQLLTYSCFVVPCDQSVCIKKFLHHPCSLTRCLLPFGWLPAPLPPIHPSHPTGHLRYCTIQVLLNPPIHIRPEDGKFIACRNVGKPTTFDAFHPRKPNSDKTEVVSFFFRLQFSPLHWLTVPSVKRSFTCRQSRAVEQCTSLHQLVRLTVFPCSTRQPTIMARSSGASQNS